MATQAMICQRCFASVPAEAQADPRFPGRLITHYALAPEFSEYNSKIVCADCYTILLNERPTVVILGPKEFKSALDS